MKEDGNNTQQGGGGATGVQIFLKICGAGGVALRLGDLGGHPLHGHSPGVVPGSDGAAADGSAPAA